MHVSPEFQQLTVGLEQQQQKGVLLIVTLPACSSSRKEKINQTLRL